MAEQVTNYKCPKCTGPLHFDSQTGKVVCDYCGSSYDPAEIEALYRDKNEKAAEAGGEAAGKQEKQEQELREQEEAGKASQESAQNWGTAEGMRMYHCPSCGAELVCDSTTAATSCPYCGNPTIIPGQFTGMQKPDLVIPFKMEKKDAVEALKKHYKGKILLPKAFSAENHIDKVQGIYVPFWMYDGSASGSATFEATRSDTYQSGDYEVTETKHYTVSRAGSISYEKVPVDASSKMPDDLMDSIEPYDYRDLKPFQTSYLPGYLADKYDVSLEECSKRADRRVEQTLYEELEGTVSGYDTCHRVNQYCELQRGTARYAMMPVWLLSTKWKDKNFLFAMNGQTGKMVGDLPVSWGKFWAIFVALAVPLSILFSIIASAIE